jgi:uncharacterized protein with von Willebrand factor type A (vWA) domain
VLRAAGMPVGTDRVLLALGALEAAGFGGREELRDVLRACLVDRAAHRALFEQAFDLYWRDPDLRGRALALLLPRVPGPARPAPRENRRLVDALFPDRGAAPAPPRPQSPLELELRLSPSDRELLRKADFETMTAAEWLAARRCIAELAATLPERPTRRMRAAGNRAHGHRPDWRRSARDAVRRGGEPAALAWRVRRTEIAPVVAIVDISGSMSRYSRMFLHFLHALAGAERRTQCFLFGTRLTAVTRALRERDPDVALEACVAAVEDWSGGTRIAACLREFNRRWARRVLAGGATVLLVTDGLERDDAGRLAFEAARLARCCRRLLWLNPLLRYQRFEPKAAGVRALLPQVDAHLPVHNLESLDGLVAALRARRSRAAVRPPGPLTPT